MSGAPAPVSSRSLGKTNRAAAFAVSTTARCITISLRRDRIGPAAARDLMALLEAIEDDDGILLLVMTGTGAGFCSGFDESVDPRLVESLAALEKPVVAIINGDARDEGLELALACDIRIALASARFALTQSRRGVIPSFGGTQRLPRLIGAAAAMRMILTGEAITALEARRLGLVTYLARNRAALGRVTGEVKSSILTRGPLAVRIAKQAVLKGYDMTLAQGIRLEEDLYALLQTSADREEGIRAFLEKRKPLFKGA
ncbi:MAG: enoyl-CoA hydratase/isomerase family protein [Candidatus Binataceae bacterium]